MIKYMPHFQDHEEFHIKVWLFNGYKNTFIPFFDKEWEKSIIKNRFSCVIYKTREYRVIKASVH